ncbi:rhodanese-like domain-containing protein [Lacinutrix sp. MedPE-SW]|uniref:rhodanese-like domain-containing protein n=1 Tax=Lacinutrix sp. MedPE-SW TaxID=1860087 RepID=UPI00091557CE|nr:rhodanese-like domain-containing protein [Lacinutrix sp. MedPE-SW]OIQ19480.1 MAG: rhodanese [Lacinutrix sp. MedPE-SW]
MKNIDQEQWQKSIAKDENAIILDVRTPKEWAEGIIENALLINVLDTEEFDAEIKKLDKNKNYYVYCRSGKRSSQACELLENINVNETYNLSGGILDWTGKTVSPK